MVKYNFEFKLEVVTAYLAGKGGYKSLANQFSISDKTTVRKWVKVYETMGESGLKRRKSHWFSVKNSDKLTLKIS